MSIDYQDDRSVDAFADEVEHRLDARAATTTPLWSLIGAWLLAGVLLTLGYRLSSGILYVLGALVVVAWVAGVYAADRDRDFVGS